MNSPLSAFLLGTFWGVFNGFLCRFMLKKNLHKSDRMFFPVFIGGILYKLFFIAASVLFFRDKKDIILLLYSVSLIFFQFIFELKPVKSDGG